MQANHPINIEALLTHVPLFNGLAPEEITRIGRHTREINIPKGGILFHKGDPCNGFHLLVYGQVKLAFTSPQGNEKVVEILSQGQSFGEAIMFMDKPYIIFAQALTDALLLHVSKAAVFEELQRDHNLCRKMLAGMAMRLHQLMNDVESYSLHSGKQRIIGYLLRELTEAEQCATQASVILSTNKGVIASRLNLTQEHFSRILHELTDLGLIVVEGRKIHIPSVANLRTHEG
ncbi:MAG: Crp/Fnr family transcriptional regulator [Azonexus sp.]|nr:Crp/Fnr family transcriptional regulator [Azonexus sp.]MDP3639113.1 Crp/Fnr family transcriptional regulator [Azonexus sp.]MDZ4315714.1 Crp/Fnr family transcriptional regulator [Azonexus sp.]